MSKFLWALIPVICSVFNPLSAQLNLSLLGQLNYSQDLSDIWGWKNPADGKEYALVGVFDGFSIVDVTNPAAPVQVQFVPGSSSIWRDIKTWDHYAYVTNETGGGLLIVDLANLPGTINTWTWTGGPLGYSSAHNIFIDENGVAYVCGSNGSLGTLFLDVATDPTAPVVLGSYTTRYVHDLFVRGDTMWTGEVYDGIFSVVDVSNKAAPAVMATQATTSDFTHNIWVSDDATWVVTTDEVSGANIDAYDVADLSDIQRIDTWRSNPGSDVIPHNVFVRGNFLITSYYRDGTTITDATYPDNLIQTGFYDSSPLSGDGFNGAWGVYPYLPSGNLLTSDIEGGLFVLGPTYVQAAYLRGMVTDSVTSTPLPGAIVSILGSPDAITASTGITGQYASGSYAAGTYTVSVSLYGYETKEITGITLSTGVETTLNVELLPLTSFAQAGIVLDSITRQPVPFAQIAFSIDDTIFYAVADGSGLFSMADLLEGTFTVYSGKWGYKTGRKTLINLDGSLGVLELEINRGLYDDFLFDFNWTRNGTATSGLWTRAVPIGTSNGPSDSNPYFDVFEDFGEACYVTGNSVGSVGDNDVDNGRTVLLSPTFNLLPYGDPRIRFHRWFYNGGGSGAPNDSLIIRISNGTTTAVIDLAVNGDAFESQWRSRDVRVLDFMEPTETMQFTVYTADQVATGHLVEGGLDTWSVYDASATSTPFATIGIPTLNPCSGSPVSFFDASIGFPIAWNWSFPGGTPSVSYDQNPVVIYNSPGIYDISLTVYNGEGTASTTLTSAVEVLDALLLDLSSSPSLSGDDGTASVVDVTGGTPPYTYLWNDPSSQTTKTATGLAPGTFLVTVTSSEGCSTTAEVTVNATASGILDPAADVSMTVAPNPFAETVQILVQHPFFHHWEVRDALGRLVEQGSNTQVILIGSSWLPGLYYFTAWGQENRLGTLPLIKMEP
jgi:choice-of-anchor B domain-containing protein